MGLPIVAYAGDWTATGNLGETVEANDNPQLQAKNSPGGSVGSITNLSLQALDTGPTWHWLIGTDLGFQKFWGPGAQDSFDGVRGGVIHTAIDKSTPLTDYTASFSRKCSASIRERDFRQRHHQCRYHDHDLCRAGWLNASPQ